jgi:hypothetical protein
MAGQAPGLRPLTENSDRWVNSDLPLAAVVLQFA